MTMNKNTFLYTTYKKITRGLHTNDDFSSLAMGFSVLVWLIILYFLYSIWPITILLYLFILSIIVLFFWIITLPRYLKDPQKIKNK